MAKMFVHYKGTKAEFAVASKDGKLLSELYFNHIVFIKGGDANGTGEAIYTHGKYYGDVKEALAALQTEVNNLKYFSGVKVAGSIETAVATSKDGVITFSAADPAQVSVNVDSKGVNIGLSKTFTDSVANNTAAISTEQGRAMGVEAGLRTDLGTRAEGEGNAFARIKSLEAAIEALTAGGEGSVSAQINAAIAGLDAEITSKDGSHVTVKVTEVDGKITAVNVTEADIASAALLGTAADDATKATAFGKAAEAKAAAEAAKTAGETAASNAKSDVIGASGDAATASTIYGAKKYADEAAAAAKSGAEATASADATSKADKALADAKSYTDGKVATINKNAEDLAARVEALDKEGGRVAVVEGKLNVLEGEGEGSVKKHVADEIAKIVNENANGSIDTLNEIAAWIINDTTGAASMANDIATLNGDETKEGSVKKQVKDAVDAEALARSNADNALDARLDVIEGEGEGSIKNAVASAKNAIDAYTINGKAISESPVLGAADINVAEGETVAAAIASLKSNMGSSSVAQQIATEIGKLDATVGEAVVAEGKHVAVQVVEVDGVLTAVNVSESDIASAQGLADVVASLAEAGAVGSKIKANADAIATLKGAADVTGSVANSIAASENRMQAKIDEKVAISDYNTKVAELEAMWEWIEL